MLNILLDPIASHALNGFRVGSSASVPLVRHVAIAIAVLRFNGESYCASKKYEVSRHLALLSKPVFIY